jgi:hypothetical protein
MEEDRSIRVRYWLGTVIATAAPLGIAREGCKKYRL